MSSRKKKPDPPWVNINIRVRPDTRDAFNAKVAAQGWDQSAIMRKMMQEYIDGEINYGDNPVI
jgi:hypothetical protein